MSKDFNFQDHIYRLLSVEPYYSELSLSIEKGVSTDVPNCGVGITKDANFKILYNPEWVSNLSEDHMHGLLRHEFEHICYEHVTTRGPEILRNLKLTDRLSKEDGLLHKKWNIACDLAINGNIPLKFLPEGGMIPGQGQFAQFPVGLSAEQYFQMLPDDPEMFEGGFDDHSHWGIVLDPDINPEDVSDLIEHAQKKLEVAMKGAIEHAEKHGWGTMPHNRIKELREMISNIVDWKSVLRFFIQCSIRSSKRSSFIKVNRKYPNIFPGRKYKRTANLMVAIDESGSISEQLFELFWAELGNLAGEITFTVVPFDTDIDYKNIITWKKGDKKPPRRVKWGGTNFQPVVDFADKMKFDGLIICTDMGAAQPTHSRIQRLWLTPKRDYDSCNWAQSLPMDRFALLEGI